MATRSKGTQRKAASNGRVSAPQVVRRAIEQVRELTGRPVEGVLGLQRAEEGWVVTIEVVELRRVPDSTDVLGSYAVAVDARGELQEYRRTRRYYRNQVEED
jgi:hypothetical protein